MHEGYKMGRKKEEEKKDRRRRRNEGRWACAGGKMLLAVCWWAPEISAYLRPTQPQSVGPFLFLIIFTTYASFCDKLETGCWI